MLRKYSGFAEAITDPDFGIFLKQVRRKLPPGEALGLLTSLDYECDVKEGDYESEFEYAAAVMGVDADWLNNQFGKKTSE